MAIGIRKAQCSMDHLPTRKYCAYFKGRDFVTLGSMAVMMLTHCRSTIAMSRSRLRFQTFCIQRSRFIYCLPFRSTSGLDPEVPWPTCLRSHIPHLWMRVGNLIQLALWVLNWVVELVGLVILKPTRQTA
jgi:hypothetical protein